MTDYPVSTCPADPQVPCNLSRTYRKGVVRVTLLEAIRAPSQPDRMTQRSPFRYFKTSPEIIRSAVMLYIRFPLSLRNAEDLLHERGIETDQRTVRFRCSGFQAKLPTKLPRRQIDRKGGRKRWWGNIQASQP